MTKPFPRAIPLEKPADRPLSAAMARMYDVWNPHEDLGNEFFSNFLYTPLTGFEESPRISRRDPSKVLRIDGVYHVYYTCRRTNSPPVGPEKATDELPARDWDLAEVWHATSKDGFHWEEQGPALRRPPKAEFGSRSNCTPDILAWKGRCYLFFQAYSEITELDLCPVSMAVADSPDGPFRPLGRPVLEPGGPEDWDSSCIHDPFPLVYQGKIWLYYKSDWRTAPPPPRGAQQDGNRLSPKGAPGRRAGGDILMRAWGVAIAGGPAGPFEKSPLNPVVNSGHETCLWPHGEGIAALLSLDGPEKNTVQYAPDGLNFEIKSHVVMPPVAPGPFVPDAFAGNGDGRGITWGLCHIIPVPGGAVNHSILARFDCSLLRGVQPHPLFKRNNRHYDAHTYFQRVLALPGDIKAQRIKSNTL